MHEEGVMHRDVKPENVVFATDALNSHQKPESMQVKLIDLGMAIVYDPKHPIKGALLEHELRCGHNATGRNYVVWQCMHWPPLGVVVTRQ